MVDLSAIFMFSHFRRANARSRQKKRANSKTPTRE